MPSVLDYFARVTPYVIKQAIMSFYSNDPLFKHLLAGRKMKLQGGSEVRVPRIVGGHSDATEINLSNFKVDFKAESVLDYGAYDWGMYVTPLVVPHINKWRANSPADYQMLVKDTVLAATTNFRQQVQKHLYLGNTVQANGQRFTKLGTLNGTITGLGAKGLENGAIRFQSPSAQTAASVSYLGMTRNFDTGRRNTNNWINWWAQHNGVSVDFFEAVEKVKSYIGAFSEDDDAGTGVTIGLCGTNTWNKISRAARIYPGTGTQAQVVLSLKELASGKGVPRITQAAGVTFYPVRWMDTDLYGFAAAASLPTEACYLIDPQAIGWYINQNMDFAMSPWRNMKETQGLYADVAMIELQAQLVVENILRVGAVSR